MPLHWTVNHIDHLVTLKSEGVLRFPELADYLKGVRAARALRYRKMFDTREGYADLNHQELTSYACAIVGYATVDRLGPYAVVVHDNFGASLGPLLHQLLLPPGRSISMFWSAAEAKAWLMAQPIPPDRALDWPLREG
jgi:hypothetical protein